MHKVNKIFGVGVFFLFFFPSVPWGKLRHPLTGGRYQLRHTVSQSFKPLKLAGRAGTLAGLDYFLTSKKHRAGSTSEFSDATCSTSSSNSGGFCLGLALWRELRGKTMKSSGEKEKKPKWEHMTKPNITSLQSVFSYPVLPRPVWASPSVIGVERIQLPHMLWCMFHRIWHKCNPTWW